MRQAKEDPNRREYGLPLLILQTCQGACHKLRRNRRLAQRIACICFYHFSM
jgi:hypothetical protein